MNTPASRPPRSDAPDSDASAQHVPNDAGAHSLGAVVGAAAGTAAGMLAGVAAGPMGSAAGAMIGAVLGGAAAGADIGAGPSVPRSPTNPGGTPALPGGPEHAITPSPRPTPAIDDHNDPAVRYGVQAYARYRGACDWADVEAELAEGWNAARGESILDWADAAPVAHAAWLRSRDVARHTLANDSPDQGLQYRAPVDKARATD